MYWLKKLGNRKRNRVTARAKAWRPRLEVLESRLTPTTTLYIDYGDRFPSGQLTTTVGQLDSTIAGDNPDIDGPRLFDSRGTSYATDTAVTITSVDTLYGTSAREMRRVMTALAQRMFDPLDITVVELTAGYRTVNGHRVRSAANLDDVSRTLGANEGDAENNDAYVIVGQFLIGPGNDNPNAFPTNGYGGLATGTDVFGDNNNDGTAFVMLVGTRDGAVFNGNQIAHEAGHLFGLPHAYRQDTGNPPPASLGLTLGPAYDMLHRSEVMSYLSYTSQGGYNAFSRYPMILGDGNTDPDVLVAAPTPFDQMRDDPNIGPADGDVAREYVTGTGAHDIINVAKTGPNVATVTILPYSDAGHTSFIPVPGPGNGAYTYSIPLDRPLRIDAGGNNDRIVIRGDLGVAVEVYGMHGEDELLILGEGTASATYTPVAVTLTGLDGNPDYRGTVTYGGTSVFFQEFELSSRITVRAINSLTLVPPGATDAITLDADPGDEFNGRASGTSDAVAFVPLSWSDVRSVTIDTGANDVAGPAGNDRVTMNAAAFAALGLRELKVMTGRGDDVLIDPAAAASPPVTVRFEGGIGTDRVEVTGDLNYRLDNSLLSGPYAGVALDRVEGARVRGGNGDNTFTVGDWTGTAWLVGIHGTDKAVVSRATDFTLGLESTIFGIGRQDRLLLGDGTRLFFFSVEEAELSDRSGAANRVTVDIDSEYEYSGLTLLTVDTGAGADRLTIQSTTPQLVIHANTGGGADTVIVHGTGSDGATIDTGADADRITVHRVTGATTIDAGDGDDTFEVTPTSGDLSLANRATLNGGAGGDRLTVFDHNNPYTGGLYNGLYDVTSTEVTRYEEWRNLQRSVGVSYSSVGQVTVHTGGQADVIRVHRGSATVKAGGGNDEIHVAPDVRNLAWTVGVTAEGGDGVDQLMAYDDNNPYDVLPPLFGLYTVAADRLTRYYQAPGVPFPSPLPAVIAHSGVEEVTLRTGALPDNVQVSGGPSLTRLITGTGVDAVNAALSGLAGKLSVDGGIDRAVLTLSGAGAAGTARSYMLDATDPGFVLDVDGARKVEAGSLVGVTLNTAAANDTVTVRATAVPMAINTGGGTDRATVEAVGAALTLNGGADLDEFAVAPGGGDITRVVGLRLDGGAGGANLAINDANRTYAPLGSHTYTITGTQVSRIGRLTEAAPPSPITLDFANVKQLAVDTGNGNDDVTVRSAVPTTVNAGFGDDTVRLGGDTGNLQLTPIVTVNGGPGLNRLVVDDRGNPYDFAGRSHQYTVTASALWRPYRVPGGIWALAAVGYSGIRELTLTTGDRATQGDEVQVRSLSAATTIRTGRGDDRVTVGEAGYPLGTWPAFPSLLPPGRGDLAFPPGQGPNQGPPLPPAGYLTVDAGDGAADALHFNDAANATPRFYTVNGAGQLSYDGADRARYSGVEYPSLTGGSDNDTIDMTGTPPGTAWEVSGGAGSDTLTGSNLVNYFLLLGADRGLGNSYTFASMENLLGGDNPDNRDYFILSYGASLSGGIDGAGGSNMLTYTQIRPELYYGDFAGDVTVNLRLGTATSVGGAVRNVQHVIGAGGNDVLVGDAAVNTLEGCGGRDVLIGGAGADTLDGGAGDDVVIGGTTVHDADTTALAALRGAWASDLPYPDRVAALRDRLNVATVSDDGATDQLSGGGDLDWFWGDLGEPLDRDEVNEHLN